jgi:hypothetical protein
MHIAINNLQRGFVLGLGHGLGGSHKKLLFRHQRNFTACNHFYLNVAGPASKVVSMVQARLRSMAHGDVHLAVDRSDA